MQLRLVISSDGGRHLFANPDETHLMCGRPFQEDWKRELVEGPFLGAAELCQQCWFIASFSDYEGASRSLPAPMGPRPPALHKGAQVRPDELQQHKG